MLLAIGVLMVTALLSAAVFEAVGGDTQLSRANLDGKRAYAAAQAGLQAYLFQLNSNATTSQWWETCTNDTQAATTVPGSSTGVYYSYQPVNTCVSTDPVGSLISSAGTLGMEFTGYSGAGCPTAGGQCQTRTIVASLRTVSPLSFLWYTVYESEDTSITGPNSGCDRMYYQNPAPPSSCYIYWVTGDSMNGPMYTQDQYLLSPNNQPTFGRSRADDIASEADLSNPSPTNSAADICAGTSKCYNDPNILGTADPSPDPKVELPSDNSSLLADAHAHGLVLPGTTTLVITGPQAVGENCTTASASSCSPVSFNLTTTPIFYATNLPGCNTTYTPDSVSYPSFSYTNPNTRTTGTAYGGPCGDIYIQGSYSAPLTLTAANDIVVTSNFTNSTDTNGTTNPTGSATAGLVADEYVRVKHDNSGNPDRTIDAAILTLSHSFFVDNYASGGSNQGTLTVHGAIAQYFRGIVGTVGASGYLKDYNYDNRLQVVLPPYLFDLQVTEWQVFRESICQGSSC